MDHKMKAGFRYLIEVVKDGRVVDSEVVFNLVPTEGLNHILNTELKGQAQVTTWYIGMYEGNYTPFATDTAATFPGAATECIAYVETLRQTYSPGTVAGGTVDNSASVAVFTLNADKTVYGAFMVSTAAKGATTGALLSAVRFSTPKAISSGSLLRITAGFVLTST